MEQIQFKNSENDLLVSIDGREFVSFLSLKKISMENQKKILNAISDKFVFMNRFIIRPYDFRLPKYILKNLPIDEVTFFGGSFNPIHEGHKACLKLCPGKNIIIVPDRNPLKENREFGPLDEFIKLINEFKDGPYSLFPGFWASSELNPTANWINKVLIKKRNLLMGDDSFMSFFSWNRPSDIINAISNIYVAPRNFKVDELESQAKKFKDINEKINIVLLSDHQFKELSSSRIREKGH
jgi:nicotinate-nucleotide adenylyltransferase